VNNWTDELLELMCDKLRERKEREREAIEAASRGGEPQQVSEDTFLDVASNMIEVKDGGKYR